jgi:beta-aspartyl-peptidase (threonine type)
MLPRMPIAIAVHGGAGARADDDTQELAETGCLAAARAGHAVLAQGGSALDAVIAAVAALEDDPVFNAGHGAALNYDGEIELDASVMEGAELRGGAVACVRDLKSPVRLARAVMERSPHLLLVGEGAQEFARAQGFATLPPGALVTPRARGRWEKARAEGAKPSRDGGTVGAVALDAQGHVAAATSTGGTPLKLRGRVGDSPILGAGTYADDEGGAASATGHGESILRVTLTRACVDRMRQGAPAPVAAEAGLVALTRVKGEGGLILVDRKGGLGLAFNTERMARGWVDAQGRAGAAFAR